MKKSFKFILIYIIVAILIFEFGSCKGINKTVNSSLLSSRYTVIIDPGHGGKDAGTIGIDSSLEKDINLSISLILRDYLEVCGINTLMTREGDYELYPEGSDKKRSDLYNRLDFVNSVENSILISIHQNHFSDESQWGAQVWYSANDDKSKEIADSILNSIKNNIQPENQRNNKQTDSNYYILYKAQRPSVMVECGFMSNKNECSNLQNIEYQNKIAYSILTGICGE